MCRFLLYIDFDFFTYIVKNGVEGSYGNSNFKFLRNIYTDFHSCCTNLHSIQHFFHILRNIYCCLFFWSLCNTGVWIQGLHLEPLHHFLCDGFFWDRAVITICLGWLRITILLISVSWVGRIAGVSHWLLAHCFFLMITTSWQGWLGITVSFWFAFPLWQKMLTISSCIHMPF
jgi:hypothetical protein